MTDRNVLHTRIDVSAGKMIRLEIKRAPIIRIPSTIVTAVSTAISVLYRLAFTPVAWANVSFYYKKEDTKRERFPPK